VRLGIDIGGTNTDAVIVDDGKVLSAVKRPTTFEPQDGITDAVNGVLHSANVSTTQIQSVMLGTTHFTNAFVERRGLLPVGIIRLALPAARGVPPLTDWPSDLVDVIGNHSYMVRGGYEFDGRYISPLDENAVARAAREMKKRGIRAVAICGVFSPIKSDMEERAEGIVHEEIPDVSVTLSSRIGRLGLLERENAAIMNAALRKLSTQVVSSFKNALSKLGITAPFYLSQNDGTLMTAEFAEKYPVLTFASGPTNSMRGAAYLSGLSEALVADIGGTTTDIGMLTKGFPRESAMAVDIGGIRTNFRMPDIISVGLGGGSIISRNGLVRVGPRSVGSRLTETALVFGGDTLTSTDIAVAAGLIEIGNRERVARLSAPLVESAVTRIHSMLEEGIDRIKISAEPMPLLLVGGGTILIGQKIAGASEEITPEYADVANAIGASIAQVGGEVDKIYSYGKLNREEAIHDAKRHAIKTAVEAGAKEGTVEIIDFDEVPLAYIPGKTVRLRVKAAGELAEC
jgi:N-methylhydantoinase A/oxoprolinase/acetone carboxylase beta subunit